MATKRSLEFSSSSKVKKTKSATSSPSTSATPEPELLSPVAISSPEDRATVKGIVTSLSPAKKTDRVFFGELCDSDAIIPLVGFDRAHRQFLYERMQREIPVVIRNCQITTNKTTGKLQLVVKSHTTLEDTDDTSIIVHDRNTLGSPFVAISELSTLTQYDRATLQITAVKVKDHITVTNGKQKQDVVIADDSGHTTLTLWEDDIGMIIENRSYQLNRVQIHHYLGKTELTFPRFGASAEQIDDLDLKQSSYDTDDTTQVNSVSIVGVTNLETTYNCINCRKNMPCDPQSKIIQCNHCQTKQKIQNYKTSAKLFMEDNSGQGYILKAHNQILASIVPTADTITDDDLLNAPSFNITFDQYNIITNVSRQ